MFQTRFFALGTAILGSLLGTAPAAPRQMEFLDRGVVAIHQPDGKVFVSWRLLAGDPDGVSFNVYRTSGPRPGGARASGPFGARPDASAGTVKVNDRPLVEGTWLVDVRASLDRTTTYTVRAVANGIEAEPGPGFTLPAGAPPLPYHAISLQRPADGRTPTGAEYGYQANDGSLADLDGDGAYEIVLKWDPDNAQDNSRPGLTGPVLLDAYRLDGTRLWRIDLGRNIRAGAHYTQFLVYDLDGDGRAEVACKTADGTVDGAGTVIGDPNADHRNENGHILKGPEFLTVFDGRTGAALSTVPYAPGRHPEKQDPTPEEMRAVWGDGNGNRSERYLACVAYLDGVRPSLVMCRGYYTRSVLAAWDWREGKLTPRWLFDSDAGPESNRAYRGQGNHNLSVADVDGDGRDEIVYGAAVIDDDGTGLYSTGWGHGDAMHVTDHVPSNPGLEVFNIQEKFSGEGMNMRDARTGRPIFLVPSVKAATEGGDRGEGPGRGNAFNIDPRHPGSEAWAAGAEMGGVFNAAGERIFEKPRGLPCNFAVWWDGDLLRELLDQNFIVKWDAASGRLETLLTAHACVSNNGTKATPVVSADLWGDWREEVVWRTRDNTELRIYTSTIPTTHRLVTLMQDPQYRLSIVWQNVAYNQPPHPGFYLDESAPRPPRPEIAVLPSSRR